MLRYCQTDSEAKSIRPPHIDDNIQLAQIGSDDVDATT